MSSKRHDDFDVGSREMLKAGARAFHTPTGDWRSIDTVPRDGTLVELRNNYGVLPTYSLCRWMDGRWKNAHPAQGGGPIDGAYLQWRPYDGDLANYVDPTGGVQWNAAYWRGGVAAKYGLPVDYFEAETARNIAPAKPVTRPRGFWAWLLRASGVAGEMSHGVRPGGEPR